MIIDDLGHPKIRYLDSILMDQYILRLNIPMDDISFLEKLQSYHHLCNESLYYLFRQLFLVVQDKVLEGPFIAVLDEEKERVGALLGINVLEDVGVRDFPEEVDFLEEGIGCDH